MIDILLDGVLRGGIYALAALGLVIIYRASKIVNLAYGAMALLAAYLYWSVSPLAGPLGGLAISVLAMLAVAVFAERVIIRPMIGEPVIQIIMATIGLSYVIRGALLAYLQLGPRLPGFQQVPFEVPLLPTGILPLGGLSINLNFLFALLSSAVALAAFLAFYRLSLLGVAMRAMSNDRQAALALGIRPTESYMLSWAIAGVLAALGGLLYSAIYGGPSSNTEMILVRALPVIVLGGLDSPGGAVVAGVVVGIAEALGSYYLEPVFGGGFGQVFPLLLILFIMLWKPYGLFGTERIERV